MSVPDLKNLSAPEKVRLISDRIKGRMGDAAALRYDSAVALYVSQGIEPMESEAFFQPFWPKTKEILDRWAAEKRAAGGKINRLERFEEIIYKNEEADERMLAALASKADVEVEEMRWLLEAFGDTFSKEGYERELELGNDWGSYSDYVNDALAAALEPEKFDYLHRMIQTVQANAEKHGIVLSFDEALDAWYELRDARRRKDWKEFEAILERLYGDRSPQTEQTE